MSYEAIGQTNKTAPKRWIDHKDSYERQRTKAITCFAIGILFFLVASVGIYCGLRDAILGATIELQRKGITRYVLWILATTPGIPFLMAAFCSYQVLRPDKNHIPDTCLREGGLEEFKFTNLTPAVREGKLTPDQADKLRLLRDTFVQKEKILAAQKSGTEDHAALQARHIITALRTSLRGLQQEIKEKWTN